MAVEELTPGDMLRVPHPGAQLLEEPFCVNVQAVVMPDPPFGSKVAVNVAFCPVATVADVGVSFRFWTQLAHTATAMIVRTNTLRSRSMGSCLGETGVRGKRLRPCISRGKIELRTKSLGVSILLPRSTEKSFFNLGALRFRCGIFLA